MSLAQTTTAPTLESVDDVNPQPTPAFVKPASPPRRKPGSIGLTLLTPGTSKSPPQEIRLAIPSTPAFTRPGTLRHFQSSPQLPMFPSIGSQGGAGLLRQRRGAPAPLDTIMSPIEPLKPLHLGEEDEQNFDVPLSQEAKPEAYPTGPICVYQPGIDLFLEPTADQCREYDVVMNVASEVRNPLAEHSEPLHAEPEIRIDGGGGIQYVPKHLQVPIEGESSAGHDPSPTTPKATPLHSMFPASATSSQTKKEPEYIHIPWEHNSDIVPDLLRLVKLMDERVNEGKRILVHCQCGVSRSASLVVAYGLYKEPTLSVQEAYDAVKEKSKWIGPNMNLIMQLQEFRSSLARGGLLPDNRGMTPITPSSAFRDFRSPFAVGAPAYPMPRTEPLSAGMASRSQGPAREALPMVSPGPSSAPSGMKWLGQDQAPPLPAKAIQRIRALSTVKPASTYVDPSGRLVPVLSVSQPGGEQDTHTHTKENDESPAQEGPDPSTPTEALASLRVEEFAMTPLQPSKELDPEDSFGLMSPSSTEFTSSPFDRSTLLASLGMGSVQPADPPRRVSSLKTRARPDQSNALVPGSTTALRGKMSSPNLREQQQLQNMQAKIEASLPSRQGVDPTMNGGVDDALMSPRATEFTKNPFAISFAAPDAPEVEPVLQSLDSDPRSPAHTAASPITRNILDVL